MLKEVGLANFTQEVLRSNGPVLVDFYAPQCVPCRQLKPILASLADEGYNIVTVDVTEESELAEHFKISAVPTLKLFNQGQVVAETKGLQNKEALKRLFSNARAA